MNCFGFGNNCYLWILILLVLFCCCGGCVEGIFDKICNLECLIPLLLVWCCCCRKGNGGFTLGGGCK